MSSRRNSLSPPERTGTWDPGAHELAESSEGEDHFSDAQSAPSSPHPPTSPIPKTRVEKIDDEPSYGEVPGTEAYRKREGDAEPDEIAIIPDPQNPSRSRMNTQAQPLTPDGQPIPKTMVEETPDEEGSKKHAEVEKKIRADPPADLVLKADGSKDGKASDSPMSPSVQSPSLKSLLSARSRGNSFVLSRGGASPSSAGPRNGGFGQDADEDEFGDDFDDFEEVNEEDDFGGFNDGFAPPAAKEPSEATPLPAPSAPTLSFPVPDLESLDHDDILATIDPYLSALFPIDESDFPPLPPLTKDANSIFLTPRSASLWAQLVAPPPLQPPDWIRSRIRRLFLVSLGVPVDLDEILPASKQKKLVLPSLQLHRASSNGSLRTSTDSRLRQPGANASSTSLDPSGGAKSMGTSGGARQRRGPAQPSLDLVAAKQLCTTTDAALDGMTDQELQVHVKKLQDMEGSAKEMLEFWTKRTDEKIGDREAFEGVIENLVMHARKVRK